MPIEHKNITGTDLHEPKGVDTALSGQVYVADGAGAGEWLDNIHNVHADMEITGNTTAMALTAASDGTLATDADYTKIVTGWSLLHADGITFNIDELVVPVAGDYSISFWASVQIAANNTTIGVKYSINDITPYSARKVLQRSDAANDITNMCAIGMAASLTPSDTVSVYIASDITSNVTIKEAGLLVTLIHPS